MPNYFAFTRKVDGTRPTLAEVDEAVCTRLGVACDPKKYYAGWYDSVGLLLAMDYDAERMRDVFREDDGSADPNNPLFGVIDALDAEFTWSAWYSPR